MRFDGVSRDILPTQWGKPCGVHHFFYVSVQKWETSPLIKNCVRGPRFFRYPIFRQTQIKNMCFFSPCKYFLLIFTYHWECIKLQNARKVPLIPWKYHCITMKSHHRPAGAQRVSEAPDTEASFTVRWLLRSPFTVLAAWRRRAVGSVDFMAGGVGWVFGFVRWDILG